MLEDALAWLQGDHAVAVVVRTAVVYAFALLVVRLGSRRFLAKASAFDVLVAIMLGSIMSRAITSSSDMVPTLLSGAVLVALHSVLARLSYRLDWLGPIVKGEPRTLVRDGEVDRTEMRKAGVSEHDLDQAIRLEGSNDLSNVRLAILERDGTISVIPRAEPPRVVEVAVADGVQTVRVELS